MCVQPPPTQSLISSITYNHTGVGYFDVSKKRPFCSIIETGGAGWAGPGRWVHTPLRSHRHLHLLTPTHNAHVSMLPWHLVSTSEVEAVELVSLSCEAFICMHRLQVSNAPPAMMWHSPLNHPKGCSDCMHLCCVDIYFSQWN